MKPKLKHVDLDFLPDKRGATLFWVDTQGEYGNICIYLNQYDQVCIQSEYMSKEFVLKALKHVVNNATLEDQ